MGFLDGYPLPIPSEFIPYRHRRCLLPGLWARLRGRVAVGLLASCPECGITYIWSTTHRWAPVTVADRAKRAALDGDWPAYGRLRDQLDTDAWLEVADFRQRWGAK